jgi:hypothetical protein
MLGHEILFWEITTLYHSFTLVYNIGATLSFKLPHVAYEGSGVAFTYA